MKRKIIRILFLVTVTIFLFAALFWTADFIFSSKAAKIDYGITFAAPYAESLGLDPDKVFQSIVTDLGVKKLRLPVYWNLTEDVPGQFDFKSTDKLLDIAKQKNIEVILALGYKLPRWPECYQPSWAMSLSQKQREERILNYLEKTVDHFKNRKEIIAWQVENEPLLDFGLCEKTNPEFLDKEVNLVRSKDSRTIILTDSGELGSWIHTMSKSDVMGTTLYRVVWNPIFGFFNYPMPPLFYRLKESVVKNIFAHNSKGVFITELQSEPWPPGKSIEEVEISEQLKIYSLNQLKETVEYAGRTGFAQQYLWGAEWWYFMKTHGHPEYWDFAKTVFR